MTRHRHLDPLLPAEQAEAMLRLCERFGSYGTYAEEGVEDDIGEGVAQRHDAVLHFLRTGGRLGHREDLPRMVARTNYFRETYAYDEPRVDGIEPFLRLEAFHEAARHVFGRPRVVPHIVYANLLVPGQELALHTDVPEFRGIQRRKDPQWLIVAMHHSGLFSRWRIPIATGVAWFGQPRGGAFAFHADGPDKPAVTLPVRHNTAVVLDTDSVFHGVDRVEVGDEPLPALRPGARLVYDGSGAWHVEQEGRQLARYGWSDLRFSVSWKAYCFADEREHQQVLEHSDDLTRARVLDTLVDDLRRRGRLERGPRDETELALAIIETYIRFPSSGPSAGG